jgi:hypothetical protein
MAEVATMLGILGDSKRFKALRHDESLSLRLDLSHLH